MDERDPLDEAYVQGRIDRCHLCNDRYAVTSDGVCSECAMKYPIPPREAPPCPSCASLRDGLKEAMDENRRLALLEEFYELIKREQASFQRWTLDMPKNVHDKLRALEGKKKENDKK